jgi:putative membrane protein
MCTHPIRVVLAVGAATMLPMLAEDTQMPSKNRASARSMGDQQFLKKAAEGGMAEVQLGQLASKNASTGCATEFGQRMVADHSKANDQAKSLAGEKNITLPASPSAKDQSLYRTLSSKTGSDFDKAYIGAMIKDHKEDITEFQQEANSGNDPDIKAWAAKTLPTLQQHLTMAEDCAKQLGISSTTGGYQR